jgi:hypothetical protein
MVNMTTTGMSQYFLRLNRNAAISLTKSIIFSSKLPTHVRGL